MKDTLYEIDSRLEFLLAQVCGEHGELNEETEVALDDLVLAKQQKALNVARYLIGEEAEAEMVKSQIARLTERMKRHQSRAEWLKAYLYKHLNFHQETYSDGAVHIGWRRSERVIITDDKSVPEEFIKETATTSIEKQALRKALKGGKSIDGATLQSYQNIQVK